MRTFDICTSLPGPELFTFPDDDGWPQAIRKLPNGQFLITTYEEVARYSAAGIRLERYPFPLSPTSRFPRELTQIALASDGSGFWMIETGPRMVKIDLQTSQTVVAVVPFSASESPERLLARAVVVFGEWRASLQPAPPAPPSRRHSVRQ